MRSGSLHRTLRGRGLASAGAMAVAIFACSPAMSEVAPAVKDEAPPVQGDTRLEEIIVTAQKRGENLQKVPIAITALTSNTLATANISQTIQLTQLTPGLVTFQTGSALLPFIRGIGSTSSQNGFDSSVAVYVDGVYIASKSSTLFSLASIERIEVLKGPQGTLFGRNATGGAINIITKDPSSAPAFNADVGYARYNDYTARFYGSVPVSDTLGFNLAGSLHRSDGYINNVLLKTKEGKLNNKALIAKLKWTPSSSFSATLSGQYTDDDDNSTASYHVRPGTISAPEAAGFQVTKNSYDSVLNIDPIIQTQSWGGTLRLDYTPGKIRVVSISAYRGANSLAVVDNDASSQIKSAAAAGLGFEQYSQELQVLSENSGPFKWIAGLYYIHDNQRYKNGLSGLIVPGANVLYPLTPAQMLSVGGSASNFNTAILTESRAAFVQGTYAFSSADRLTAGVRYTSETKSANGSLVRITATPTNPEPQFVFTTLASFGPTGVRSTFTKPTWRLSYDHDFSPDILGYVSYNRGFKSGSFNPTVVSPLAVAVRPEVLDAYEVGLKSQFLDRSLRVNMAGYYYNFTDIQVGTLGGVGGTASTQNAAKAKVYGFDFDLDYAPVNNLSIRLGLSLNHSEYQDYTNAAVYIPLLGGGTQLVAKDASGSPLVFAPTMTLTAGINYVIPSGDSHFDINLHGYHNSGYDVTPLGIGTHINSYTTIGSSITWHSPNDAFFARVWGENLASEKYPIQIASGGLGYFEALAKPVTFGLTLGLKFNP